MLPVGKVSSPHPQLNFLEKIKSNVLCEKIKELWNCLINSCPCSFLPLNAIRLGNTKIGLLEQQIRASIDKIGIKEAEFKQITLPSITHTELIKTLEKESLVKRQEWINTFQEAFNEAVRGLKAGGLNFVKPPHKIAFQLAEILQRYGLVLYASRQAKEPFLHSLNILRTAFLIQEYALKLRDTCPDLSLIEDLDAFHTNREIQSLYEKQVNEAILHLSPEVWVKRISHLTGNQISVLCLILSYVNGAMRHLNLATIQSSNSLIETAQACLISACNRLGYNRSEFSDRLAELKYNERAELIAKQIEESKVKGENTLTLELKAKLSDLWEECISLSKDPEKMRARCENKRTFIEELTFKKILELRRSAVKRHEALPKDRQDSVFQALAWSNLSRIEADLEQEEAAYFSASQAFHLMMECQARGIDNIQFNQVVVNYLQRCERKIKKVQSENRLLEAILKPPASTST